MGAPPRPVPPRDEPASGPVSPDFLTRAEELRRLGRRTEALALCRDGLARFPSFHSARALYGRLLLENGDVSGARTHLQDVLARVPGHLAARRWLADALERAGAREEAARLAESTEGLAPHEVRLRAAFDRLFGPSAPRTGPPTHSTGPAAKSTSSLPSADDREVGLPSLLTTNGPEGDAPSWPSRAARIAALQRWLDAVRRACPDSLSEAQ